MQLASGTASFLSGLVIAKSAGGEILNYSYVGYGAVVFTLAAILIARKIKPVPQEVKVNPESEKLADEEIHAIAEM